MRKIFIIGMGNFGYHCALGLEGKAEVTAVDQDRIKIQRIGSHVDRAVVGDARKKEFLQEIGAEVADVVIVSMGESMEASIITTLHLKGLGIKEIFVKANSDEHTEVLQLIGATRVLQPEREVAENLAVSIIGPNITDYLRLHRHFGIIEIPAPESTQGKTIAETELRTEFGVTIIGVFRNQDKLVNPDSTTLIRKGDRLVLLGEEGRLLQFQKKLG